MQEHEEDIQQQGDWPAWLDRHRYQSGLAVFLIFFLLYGFLVYVSGKRPLTPLEQASMAVIGFVISGAFGVVLGIPLAKRRVKIASQLRRAYGISQTLRSVQRDVEEATARMKGRVQITDPQVLGEFWSEIARNIRTALRAPMLEAERMVEDWGEMDPTERSRIQAEERQKLSQIEELTREIQTARSVEKDLEGVEGAGGKLAATVERLEQRIRELQEVRSARVLETPAASARDLLDQGQYRDAIEAYNRVIHRYPGVHTNFIGRAKARYLAGDPAGALEDLDTARGMFPSDAAIASLEEQIRAGKALTTPVASGATKEATAGNKALSVGDSPVAAEHYRKAEELGLNPFFAKFNFAMVKCLDGECTETVAILDSITAGEGTYMDVNKCALRAICSVRDGEPVSEPLAELQLRVQRTEFDYERSPLRHLELGLKAADPEEFAKLDAIFGALRSSSASII
jgi:tetratricopeptide (TPR) repeat protein